MLLVAATPIKPCNAWLRTASCPAEKAIRPDAPGGFHRDLRRVPIPLWESEAALRSGSELNHGASHPWPEFAQDTGGRPLERQCQTDCDPRGVATRMRYRLCSV